MTELYDELDDLVRQALNDPVNLPESGGLADVRRRTRVYTSVTPTPRRLRRSRHRIDAAKHRWAFRASLAAAVAAAAVLALLLAPSSSPTILEQAAAALHGSGSVVHVVWTETWRSDPTTVDLESGAEHAAPASRLEAWYDATRHVYKQQALVAGQPTFAAWTNGSESVDPEFGLKPGSYVRPSALVQLFSHYRQALTDGTATLAGDGTVDGHQVDFIDAVVRGPAYVVGSDTPIVADAEHPVRIAVDKETFAPVAVYLNGDSSDPNGVQHIEAAELVQPAEADLTRPPLPAKAPWPRSDRGILLPPESHPLDRGAIAGWLGHAPVGVQDSLAGRPFAAARAQDLRAAGHGVELVYGDACDGKPQADGQFVLVEESTQPAQIYGLGAQPPRPVRQSTLGQLVMGLDTCGARDDGELWYLTFRMDGVDVAVVSADRALAVASARAIVGS